MRLRAALFAMVLMPGLALAQGQDVVGAEALFVQGRTLMQQGKYAEACPKFEASQRLDPGVGTLLNLGDCYEKNGEIAKAWARFREAAALATSAGQRDREQIARQRAAALEGKLAKLTLTAPPGTEVKLDGARFDPAVWGTAVPVDPGDHTIEASAPGKKPFSSRVTVASSAATRVEIPALEDASPGVAPTPIPAPTPTPAPVTTVNASADRSTGSTQRTLAILSLGVGVVGLGVGTALGLMSSSKWDQAKQGCTPAGCDAESRKRGEDAGTLADISTVGFVAGGVGVVAAAVLWFTAPSATQPTLTISSSGSAVGVAGRF
jgi:tetratricopeptide (TPR) repeat protein